jgi:hypothetical protein
MTPSSYLTDLPNASNFGESFNYAVWTPNTQIELCNVPWTSDYRDIVDFDTQAALDAYLDTVAGPKIKIAKMTLARAGDPVRINLPFNAAYTFNYLRVNNGTDPVTARYTDPDGIVRSVTDVPKTLYYFIQDVSYLAPNTTQLSVMLDVWQTFGRDINFGNCYVERGHIGIANNVQFQNQGRDYLTVPEALDIGNEYNINETYKFQIPDNQVSDDANSAAWIVIGIAADVSADPGDTSSPNLSTTVDLANSDGMPNGFNLIYFKSIEDFKWFIFNFTAQPWITQSIMFITLIPPLHEVTDELSLSPQSIWDTNAKAIVTDKGWNVDSNHTVRINRKIATSFRNAAAAFVPDRYRILNKFYTSPYMWIEMTTYNGAPLMLRPELIPSDDLDVDIYQHSAPPSPRWAIVPSHYNATGTSGDADDGEFLDFATYITNFPQFTVLNNNYLSYLAANKNSIAYGYSSADWSQQKALHGASTGFDVSQAGISNTLGQASAQKTLNNQMTNLANMNQIYDSVKDVGNTIAGGNPLAAGAHALTAGMDAAVAVSNNSAKNSFQNNAINNQTSSSISYANIAANRNYDFAQYAAKGDYQNSINAVQARVQDAKMIQPSSVGQIGGESLIPSLFGPSLGSGYSFDIKNYAGWRIYAKIKMINPGYMVLIGEYWLRYGYAVNRFHTMPSSLKCMTKFTYWKLKETYITSSLCPEVYKQTIRGIFEKGVTVWVTPTDIGNIDIASNEPIAGITL